MRKSAIEFMIQSSQVTQPPNRVQSIHLWMDAHTRLWCVMRSILFCRAHRWPHSGLRHVFVNRFFGVNWNAVDTRWMGVCASSTRRNNRMRFCAVTCLSRFDLIENNRHQVVTQMNAPRPHQNALIQRWRRATLVHLLRVGFRRPPKRMEDLNRSCIALSI